MADYRIGLIGCGGIAGTWVQAVEAQPDSRITHAFDLNAEAAATRAEEAGATAVSDLDDLLGADIDLVVICTPTTSHPELTKKAAEAGKHVMCEKPMALTLAECRQMMDACASAGVQLAIGHTIRFFGTFRTVRRLVAEGAIGEPVSGSFDRTSPAKPRPVGEPGRWSGGHWREDPGTSGGSVLEGFIHELDCTRSVFGTVAGVSADIAGNQEYGGFLSPQTVQGLIRFDNGALVTARTGAAVGVPTRGYWIGGTEGGLRFDRWGQPVLLYKPDAEEPEEVAAETNNPYTVELEDLLAAIRGDIDEPENSGQNGLENVGLGLAFYRSTETGTRVAFTDGVPDLPEDYRNTRFTF
jgi:1,5-anhydro-D-fructose reductase (1,5-anhydro-D-mannitol-forming)